MKLLDYALIALGLAILVWALLHGDRVARWCNGPRPPAGRARSFASESFC